jgi:hydrogenase maturation protease
MIILIMGIGQSLRSDDGAGPAAVRFWQQRYPETASQPEIKILEYASPDLDLLNSLEHCQAAILVDAVSSNSLPGTIHLLNESDLLTDTEPVHTVHAWGVAEILSLGRQLQLPIPAQIKFIGIEAEDLSPGEKLSQPVLAVLEQAANLIEDSVKIFLQPS